MTTPEPGHYPQTSETYGYALEARGSIEIEKDTSSLDRSHVPANSYERKAVSALSENEMLVYIRNKESSGNPTAQNPISSAYGLYGFLDSTWGSVGCVKTSDPVEQERCAIRYIEQRYGGIEGAYRFHRQMDWY